MNIYPTLYIGLGSCGKRALCSIKSHFVNLCEEDLFQYARFLWIGLEKGDDKSASDKDLIELTDLERLQLFLDDESIRALQNSNPGVELNWWSQEKEYGQLSRADARMAFLQKQKLMRDKKLDNLINDCKDDFLGGGDVSFRVYIFTSMDEPESGILFDLAIHLRSRGIANLLIVPWIHFKGIFQQNDYYFHSHESIYAMSRELAYMMKSTEKVWKDDFTSTSTIIDRPLFDNVFIFESPRDMRSVSQTAFSLIENKISTAVNHILISGKGDLRISNLSSYSFEIPARNILDYAALNFLNHCLFSEGNSGHPAGIFQDKENELVDYDDYMGNEVLRYLVLSGSPFTLLARMIRNNRVSIGFTAEEFIEGRPLIVTKSVEYINQRFDEIINTRELNPLQWQSAFLNCLEMKLNDLELLISGSRLDQHRKNAVIDFVGQMMRIRNYLFTGNRDFSDEIRKTKKELDRECDKQKIETTEEDALWVNIISSVKRESIADYLLRSLYSKHGENIFNELVSYVKLRWEKTENGLPTLTCSTNNSYSLDIQDQSEFIAELRKISLSFVSREFKGNLSLNSFLSKPEVSEYIREELQKSCNVTETLKLTGCKIEERSQFAKIPLIGFENVEAIFEESNFSNYLDRKLFSDIPSQIMFFDLLTGIKMRELYSVNEARQDYTKMHKKKGHVIPALQTAVNYENKIQEFRERLHVFKNIDDEYLPPQHEFNSSLINLMAYPNRLELASWMLYFDWIKYKNNEYLIELNDSIITLKDDYNVSSPKTLEAAFINFILGMPHKSNNNAHRLFRTKYLDTIQQLQWKVDKQKESSAEDQRTIIRINQHIGRKLTRWESTEDPFIRDLIVFMNFMVQNQDSGVNI